MKSLIVVHRQLIDNLFVTFPFCLLQRWLAEDFQKERQRHIGNAKKMTKAVDLFHKSKDARKLKKSKVS